MEPTTLRLPEDLAETLAAEAEEYGYGSRSEYIRRILRNRPDADPAEVDGGTRARQSVAELRERVAALERRVDAIDEPPEGTAETDAEVDPETYADGVWTAVERVAADWDDPPERLRARKAAAAAVVDHAATSGTAMGRADAIDRFHDEHPVEGQYPGAWWRRTVRPVLRAVGEYSLGEGGYRVEALPAD